MRWLTYIHPLVGATVRSASVGSLQEARLRASEQACTLHIDPLAYEEMVAAGVAPPRPPAEHPGSPPTGE